MTKKILNTAVVMYLFFLLIVLSACKPAIGTPWYPRTAADEARKFYITEISVYGNPVSPFLAEQPADEADKLKKFVEAKEYFVNVAPSIEEILPENIKVKAVSSLSKKEEVAVTVEINGDGVPLRAGAAVPVTVKIKDVQAQYGEVTKVIKITRNEPFDLTLESLTIDGVDAMGGSVTLPYKKSMISAADIRAEFSYGTQKTVIPVILEKNTVELKEEDSIDIKISVRALPGQYKDFEHFVSVTRAKRAEGEDVALEPLEMYVQGIKNEIGKDISVPINTTQITEDDIVVIFKTFDSLPVQLTPNPITFDSSDSVDVELSVAASPGKHLAWKMKFTVKKNAAAVYNPVDKNGNKKYVVKVNTITEHIAPFTYYDENYDFPASKFDGWVLNMPAMSGIIASYKFIEGSWSGTPETWNNQPDTIGSGLSAISNVKIYRYKTRAERWAGGYVPAADPNDSRFYFYRFTANASMGIRPDNSMFCVDRYSKFLFYYSEPSYIRSIAGNKVPENWVDYAAPTAGDHIQFGEPFYMSDPVGYVKEDGSVVMYSWIKDNINNSNYHAQKNPAFTKPAEKKASGAGFSPYRKEVVTKRTEVVTTVNPAYTLAQPLILAQPKTLRIRINSTEDAAMTVKTAPVPEGESLSYKWYKHGEQSNTGGTLIPNADSASYRPDATVEENCYVYCEVTNTNSANGLTDTVTSDVVKLLIKPPHLLVTDAAQPKILLDPKSDIIPINTSTTLTLRAHAVSMDMGQISYQWYQNTEDNNENGQILPGESGQILPDGPSASLTVTVDTSGVNTCYYYCLFTNTNDKVDGLNTASRASEVAKIEVQELYPLGFKVNDPDAGRVVALRDGKPIELGSYVKKGDKIQFIAFCNTDYETQTWEGAKATGNINLAEITINSEEDAKNTVCDMAYIPPGKLTVTATQLKNNNFGNEDDNHGYFIYDYMIYSYYDQSQPLSFKSIWSRNNGKKLSLEWKKEKANIADWIKKGHTSSHSLNLQERYEYFKLDTELVHYYAEYGWIPAFYYPKSEQILSDYQQSIITFKYNRQTDTWDCITPNSFSIPNVTVKYDANFKLIKGETKPFVIRYSYTGEVSGAAEVTYTLKWE